MMSLPPERQAAVADALQRPLTLVATSGGYLCPKGAKADLDAFFEAAGAPTDPIERALLGHVRFMDTVAQSLHSRAATATTAKEIVALNGAALANTAELRRLALDLLKYRERANAAHRASTGLAFRLTVDVKQVRSNNVAVDESSVSAGAPIPPSPAESTLSGTDAGAPTASRSPEWRQAPSDRAMPATVRGEKLP